MASSAENANNLGAPAEGFGQNVTFAVRPGQVPSDDDLGRAVPIQSGVEGGQGQRAMEDHTIVAAKPAEDKTYAMLLDAGQELLAPKLKEARTKAFVQGMSQAAQGEAVTDIVDSQPWYAKIFGDSDVVAGARAYTGHATAAAAAGALEDQMPQLRTMEPADAQKVFTQTITKSLTGDPQTDLQIMNTLTQQMPALMRRQAKENYAYKQDQAGKAESKSMVAGAQALQASAQGTVFEVPPDGDGGERQYLPGATTPEDFAASSQAWMKSAIPAAGRDVNNWQISTTNTLKTLARGGMFHALNVWEKNGGLDALTVEQAQSVRDVRESEEKSQRSLNEGPYLQKIADIKAGMKYGPGSTTDYMKEMDDVNNAYQARTGSKIGIFTPSERVALATEGIETIRKNRIAEIKAAAADAAKANTQAAKDAADVDGANRTYGILNNGGDLTGVPAKYVQNAWVTARGKPDYLSTVSNAFYKAGGNIDEGQAKSARALIEGGIANSDPNAILGVYNNFWKPLYNGGKGGPVADAYFKGDDDMAHKMRVFDSIYSQGPQFAGAAMQAAFIQPKLTTNIGTGKDADQLRADVRDVVTTKLPEWWGGDSTVSGNISLRDDNEGMVAGIVKHDTEQNMLNSQDHSVATKIALYRAKRAGLNTLGGYAWQDPAGSKPFVQALDTDVPHDQVAGALRDTIKGKVEAAGMKESDHIQLIRDTDSPSGDPRFVAFVTNKDADMKAVPLTGTEISATYKAGKVAKERAHSPVIQKQEELRKAVQESRVQSRAALNAGIATE